MKYCFFFAAIFLLSCTSYQPAPLSKEDSIRSDSFMKARYKEVTENSPAVHFMQRLRENKYIVDADITSVKFLYISVVNDGVNKDAMAEYYCRMAIDSGLNIAAVKIVDAATAKFPHDGSVQGEELGKAFCK